MLIYFDYETTAPTDNCLDLEQKQMFVVSNVMIVAFHPDLKLNQMTNQVNQVNFLSDKRIYNIKKYFQLIN